LLTAAATLAVGQSATPASAPPILEAFTLGKVFTFLFLTLGPWNVIGPFAEMTRGRDASFRRRLALQGTLISAVALLTAATIGAKTLTDWGVSTASVFITIGILLFLTGLQLVLAQYQPQHSPAEPAGVGTAPAPSTFALAFSPLAFPTIVTPYGIAVLVLAMTLASKETASEVQILGIAALVLVADLLVMLATRPGLSRPWIGAAFGIVGCVMAVLQIALGVHAIVVGLRLLGVVATAIG
jgi:small neutral amino acid transporter SnatA (MarC family)